MDSENILEKMKLLFFPKRKGNKKIPSYDISKIWVKNLAAIKNLKKEKNVIVILEL